MKNIFYLLTTIFFTIFALAGCIDTDGARNSPNQSQESEKIIKKAVWNQLSNQEKQYIIGDWENATISKSVLNKYNSRRANESYEGKEVYRIHFPSNVDAPEKIDVYVDMDTNEIVGYNK